MASTYRDVSKLDRSEGQKNRIAREAGELLKAIENELDPDNFTFQEMEEEIGGYVGDKKRFNLWFGYLKSAGFVETIDEDEGRYRLVREKLNPPVPREGFI